MISHESLGFVIARLIHRFLFYNPHVELYQYLYTLMILLLLVLIQVCLIILFIFLENELSLNDLENLHYSLAIEVINRNDGLFLNQTIYAIDRLERVSMRDCKPISIPYHPTIIYTRQMEP